MTAAAFLAGAAGLGAGFATDNGPLLIVGFWVLLVAFALILHRDWEINETVTRDPYWRTLDELYAWPTAAPGTYPHLED